MCAAADVIPNSCLATANLADTSQDPAKRIQIVRQRETVIAYTKCWHTKARSFVATALYSIAQTLFRKCSTFNINSVTSALQQAWKCLQHMDRRDEEQVMIQ